MTSTVRPCDCFRLLKSTVKYWRKDMENSYFIAICDGFPEENFATYLIIE